MHILSIRRNDNQHHQRHGDTDPGRHQVGRKTGDGQHQQDFLGAYATEDIASDANTGGDPLG